MEPSIIVAVVSGVALLALVVGAVLLLRRQKSRQPTQATGPVADTDPGIGLDSVKPMARRGPDREGREDQQDVPPLAIHRDEAIQSSHVPDSPVEESRRLAAMQSLTLAAGAWDSESRRHLRLRVPERVSGSIEEQGLAQWHNPDVPAEFTRTLEAALTPTSQLDRQDRAALVLEFGELLHRMHSSGWAYGATCWESLLFKPGPDFEVLVDHIQSARRMGHPSAFPRLPANAWRRSDDTLLPSFDLDRYQFALLAHRLLLAQSTDAALPATQAERDSLLDVVDPRYRIPVGSLLARAGGPVGSRPPVSEWLRYLSQGVFAESRDGDTNTDT